MYVGPICIFLNDQRLKCFSAKRTFIWNDNRLIFYSKLTKPLYLLGVILMEEDRTWPTFSIEVTASFTFNPAILLCHSYCSCCLSILVVKPIPSFTYKHLSSTQRTFKKSDWIHGTNSTNNGWLVSKSGINIWRINDLLAAHQLGIVR